MEGLIPLVYRAIKKSNTRRKYRCLSHGPVQRLHSFDSHVNTHLYLPPPPPPPTTTEKYAGYEEGSFRHRRYHSFHDIPGDYSPEMGRRDEGRLTKEVGGFRSHRFFSCVSGGS
ncbi:hypothetical protein H6P81_013000 [Aristolochia fimbriata]|uniref:Uncharacterized protein n=1 Tax=Aristolochia fimbriata TaxID=158543 RepID=A0AAV7EDF5_ARIFI|nr:hypothetical protein H6P81_013000 [Aristolochia fimbriata]